MDCFHCPHAAAIARGDYADCAWQDTPCFGCECGSGADLQPYREAVRVDERLVADGRPGPADEAAALDPAPGGYPLSVLASALDALLRLSPEDFEILRMRRDGRTWEEISLTLCLRVEACQMRMTRLVRREPLLVELVPTLKGKLARRALRGG
jgi:hypothetical protein